MVAAGGLLARDDIPFPALNRCASFMREGRAKISTASSHILVYFFTVLNSEWFKVGWDFFCQVPLMQLYPWAWGTASVETVLLAVCMWGRLGREARAEVQVREVVRLLFVMLLAQS